MSASRSGALLSLHGAGGLAGWQWLFLLEGAPAVVLGVIVLRGDGLKAVLYRIVPN